MSENSKYQKELIKCVEDKAVSDILLEKLLEQHQLPLGILTERKLNPSMRLVPP